MSYEKYIKYKIKYLKLKELEKKLISDDGLFINNNKILNGGGNAKYKLCNNCYKSNNTKHKSCKLCKNSHNNIFNISQLTDTPNIINLNNNKNNITQSLVDKLQINKNNDYILNGGNINNDLNNHDSENSNLNDHDFEEHDLENSNLNDHDFEEHDSENSISSNSELNNNLYSIEERKIDLISNNSNSINKLKELSNKKQLLNISDISSETDSLHLSLFDSDT